MKNYQKLTRGTATGTLSLLAIAWLALALLMFAATSCGPSGQQNKLVGSWRFEGGQFTMTFSQDHTYVTTIPGPASHSLTGHWRLDGNKLVTTSRSSGKGTDEGGKEETVEIAKLDDKTLILKAKRKDGKEDVRSFTRVK